MKLVPSFLRRGPWRRLSDLDVVHTLAIATVACAATGGLLYLAYFIHVLNIARRAPVAMARARVLLVFGKRLVNGRPDAEYLARISRAHEQIAVGRCDVVLLLGGVSSAGISEALAARDELNRLGVPQHVDIIVEDASIDTLENLRNARDLLSTHPAVLVALLSSRYHLARCAALARQLGFEHELCAAEAQFTPTLARLGRIALEAGYILWADIGTRWARLIGNRRMLERVT
jgi:uncharacterized SAM-binding protein YcdF (DUF218 family)